MSYLELTDLSAAQAARVIAELGPWTVTPEMLDNLFAGRSYSRFRAARDEVVEIRIQHAADCDLTHYDISVECDDEFAARLRAAAREEEE